MERSPAPATCDEDAWLDRRDAWWTGHFSGSATQDLVAPSLGLVRNDDRVLVSWRVPTLPRPDRTFLSPLGSATVSFQSVAAALDEFAASVDGWTSGAVSGATPLEGRSALEYYTGLASDELTAFAFRPGASEDPAGDPLAQVVRDLTHRTATGAARQAIVDFVRTPGRPGGEEWWTLRRTLVSAQQDEVEAEGYAAARAVRDRLGLDGQPLGDVEHLARGLDVHVDSASPAAAMDRMAVVGEASGPASIMVLANRRTATPWGRRFEIVRGLGHLLLDPPREQVIGAASGPQAMATRRRRSGAFAAELLLPHRALLDASDGALDGIVQDMRFPDLLSRFGVGATTAAFRLWNGGLLSSPEIRDDLIASV